MDIEKVRQLIELMKEHELTELIVRDGESRVVLRRGPTGQPYVGGPATPGYAPAPTLAGVPAAPGVPAPAAPEPKAEAPGLVAVRSPMVGTFYAASDPDSPPYAQVGSEVEPNTVVCIIEAMKVLNEIKAEVAGTVERVLVANAQPVEFGQPLLMVLPRK